MASEHPLSHGIRHDLRLPVSRRQEIADAMLAERTKTDDR